MKAAVGLVVVAVALPVAAGVRSEPPVAVSPGSPSGTIVPGPCPSFSWGGTEGAELYELVVYRGPYEGGGDAEPILVERVAGSALSWTPSLGRCLEPGGSYAWSIRVVGTGEASEWSEPLLFQVAPGPSEEDFQRALLVVERYLGTGEAAEEEPGSRSAAAADSARKRAEPAPEPRALGGADFSIDSSGNVAGLSFTGNGSGLANVTAVDLVGGACVSEAELDFAAATDAELAAHAALASAHHAPAADTSCTVTDNGDGSATLSCDDGSGVSWYLTKAVAISAHAYHTCGLLAGGSVVCWGANAHGQLTPAIALFRQVSAGFGHTCGVRFDSSVACWGLNDYGQSSPPAGAFSHVSAGDNHTCGIRSDGSVACWGNNYYGQSTAPGGAFSQVSGGGYHTCGVRSDGSVTCWGNNEFSQSSPPAGAFRQVSAGYWHTCGLRHDGSLDCWGRNDSLQSTPPAGTFTLISAGGYHTCGLQGSASVACWGYNVSGQATPPVGAFDQVSTGYWHSCGLRHDRSVTCWGWNAYGQRDVPPALQ